ncbi:ABC-type sugar transport system, periplasmic component [Legionella oakridgensis ATCC 33761 = DSM 21215]|uniref:sn-glycerol-3-phosphate-binding periplasmic protein UgpB n=3 Tax=Legionella oakridgensis TaxID=29423 RepID=W0BFB4_9GAMM|nr:ABC-type sugar transport system, periplasmic component [Legionella oakridgensis ATCC 33761 = DSM 21215]ETO93032.1 carbohydrate ABC transporter substrate-binding protein, CUT1 family [Legionella oakridgensis RV-2-2007]KTD43440.1 glycerol-3-phosphate binding periplasmic protein [Legionella oakridgensis]STY20431.1 sn-glycerol 3-phosphate ABC transporter substrate-binding protein [Legionella longbeachae]
MLAIVMFIFSMPSQAKPIEIIWWHSLAGKLGEEVKKLTDGFNQNQSDYFIKPIYKGDYLECLTSFAAAFQAKQPPAMVQIFEVGKPTMLAPAGIIKPVGQLMQEQGLSLPQNNFFPAVRDYYSEDGRLMAMPFNVSVPAMFYNADALAKIGYTAKNFPQTWEELEVLAEQLKKAGYPCVYTSAHPAWILLESFAAIHGLPMIDVYGRQALYNNPQVIRHLERLVRWQRLHYFEYGGRTDDPTLLFTSGRCPLFSQSSGAYNSLVNLVPFKVGVAPIPLDKQASVKRYTNVSGGAALWVVAGLSAIQYEGIARFFVYLAQPEVQQQWHRNTGYLPLGVGGIYQSFVDRKQHPSLTLAQHELAGMQMQANGCHLGMQNQIRVINDESLEAIFAGIKSPKEAMNTAVLRANHALLRFKRNTGQ